MNFLFFRSLWGMESLSIKESLNQIKQDGYNGFEFAVLFSPEPPEQVTRKAQDLDLQVIAQVLSEGKTEKEHRESLLQQIETAVKAEPLFIISHTGRDIFSFEENIALFQTALRVSEECGIPIIHETHRSRALFSTVSTRRYLESLPELRINADFSHWCCVHESFLEDQPGIIDSAIRRTDHIHARVGFPEGPQVPDPQAPEWEEALEVHLNWWDKIVELKKKEGAQFCTITPEFGPVPYVPIEPYTQRPLGDIREINNFMKKLLQERYEA